MCFLVKAYDISMLEHLSIVSIFPVMYALLNTVINIISYTFFDWILKLFPSFWAVDD